MEWLKGWGPFLWEVINNWAGYSTGGIVVALLALWFTVRQTSISKKLGLIVALLFLLSAFYNAWFEKQRLAQAAQARLSELTVPQFTVSIPGLVFAPVGANDAATLVTLMPRVFNRGAPSIIASMRLEARFQDARVIEGVELMKPAPSSEITLYSGGKENSDKRDGILLLGSGHLRLKASEAPIVSGGAVDGWLMATFPVKTSDFAEPHTVVTIYIKDITGKEWSGHTSTGVSGHPPSLDQLKQETN